MYETLMAVGYVLAALASGALIASVAMFFGFRIPELYKELNGNLQQKQIEEIRNKSLSMFRQRGKINVFEELEKKAKVKRNDTASLNIGTSARLDLVGNTQRKRTPNPGTTVLSGKVSAVDTDFVIVKNIMFVSTADVL